MSISHGAGSGPGPMTGGIGSLKSLSMAQRGILATLLQNSFTCGGSPW
jgi:hypothetical protein